MSSKTKIFPTFAHMSKPVFKIINKSNNPLPQYATKGSSGMDIRAWLEENVGECDGPGDEHVINIGAGWELFRMYNGKPEMPDPDHDTSITWHVDITDEKLSTMFALKWIK
jgi:hypothetical protein